MVLIYLPLSPPIRLLQIVGLCSKIGVRDPFLFGLRLLAPPDPRGTFITLVARVALVRQDVSDLWCTLRYQASGEIDNNPLVGRERNQLCAVDGLSRIQRQESCHKHLLLLGATYSPLYISAKRGSGVQTPHNFLKNSLRRTD